VDFPGFLMQMEEPDGPKVLMMRSSPRVLVMMKAHRHLMTEVMLYMMLSGAIRMHPKVTKATRCERKGVAFRMCRQFNLCKFKWRV
jgi:hypothetical protein